jgi:tRNA 2-selenouridine synthase
VLNILPIDDWLVTTSSLPVIDVRSEGEYSHANIPTSSSLPLLNNEERAIVGTIYKQQGNEAAVLKGYELVGHKFEKYIQQAKIIAPQKELGVYCWRGGLRSNIMAFVLHTAGFKVHLLKGGYKNYRAWVIEQLNTPKNVVVIGGKTGSGKTSIIHMLKHQGAQVINLEELANHRGSAFGALGMPAQPSAEQFENNLASKWCRLKTTSPVFIENESRTIGSVVIPLPIFELMKQAITIAIDIPFELRVQHIIALYGKYGKQELEWCTQKLAKRLGDLRLRQALEFLSENDLEQWATLLLQYYDKTYEYGNSLRQKEKLKHAYFDTFDAEKIVTSILTNTYHT